MPRIRRSLRREGTEGPAEPKTFNDLSAMVESQKGPRRIPLWKKQTDILRSKGTTPRDLYESDPFYVYKPPHVARHVRLLWMSDPVWQKRPVLPGFRYDIYQPVTEDVMSELGLKPATKDRTVDGVPKVGMDAFLVWAPEEIAHEQDQIFLRGANIVEQMAAAKNSLEEKFRGQDQGAVGDVIVADSPEQLIAAEERQRGETGDRTFGGIVPPEPTEQVS